VDCYQCLANICAGRDGCTGWKVVTWGCGKIAVASGGYARETRAQHPRIQYKCLTTSRGKTVTLHVLVVLLWSYFVTVSKLFNVYLFKLLNFYFDCW